MKVLYTDLHSNFIFGYKPVCLLKVRFLSEHISHQIIDYMTFCSEFMSAASIEQFPFKTTKVSLLYLFTACPSCRELEKVIIYKEATLHWIAAKPNALLLTHTRVLTCTMSCLLRINLYCSNTHLCIYLITSPLTDWMIKSISKTRLYPIKAYAPI